MAVHRLPQRGWGWIREQECRDPECEDCPYHQSKLLKHVHFGSCYSVKDCPGQSVIYNCDRWSGSSGETRWANPYCEGAPKHVLDGNFCYAHSSNNEQCGIGSKPRRWYTTYSCYYSQLPDGELRAAEEMEVTDTNINVGIAMAMLLLVCFIGLVVGYLMHRRRKKKKSAENNSFLCDADTDNI